MRELTYKVTVTDGIMGDVIGSSTAQTVEGAWNCAWLDLIGESFPDKTVDKDDALSALRAGIGIRIWGKTIVHHNGNRYTPCRDVTVIRCEREVIGAS